MPGPAARAALRPPSRPAPAATGGALLALVHDGSDRGVLEAAEASMAEALDGSVAALVVLALPSGDAVPRLRAFLQRHRPAGVVLLPPLPERPGLAHLCAEAGVPCARLGFTRGHEGADGQHAIASDERRAARDLVAWLVAQGHARIGFVSGPEDSLAAQQRELGYLDAMADAGLDRGPALIVPGDNSFVSGIEAGRLLLEISPRPTAVVSSNDEMAAGLLHAAAQMGVAVPGELSVACIGDSALLARTLPTLTAMHIPWDVMAAEAVRLVTGEDAPREMEFFASLVVRDSVAAL